MKSKFLFRTAAAVLALSACAQANAQLIISEFRVRGPNGANDEFVEIYNNSGASHVVAGGGTGYAVAASNGVARCVIPNGTVIPDRGHYLCVNSVGYGLASYPAGNGTTATGDATYTTDIPDNAGIAIFNTSIGGDFVLANRMDAVGSTSEANTLFKEGAGYPALTPFSIDYAFHRDACGKSGSITTFGACTIGTPKDTNGNAADFVFVDTNGTSAGAGQRLGAPGPENLSGPIAGDGSVVADRLDSCVGVAAPPNRVRDFTSDPANNSTFGTLDFRQTITNQTGANLTRMRFRIVDLTTFPAPSGIADLRPRTSTAVVVTVDRPPCAAGTSNVTVQGTTLEQPPSQPNGGGFNSTLGAGTITLATPLANGAAIDVRYLFGIQQTGCFKLGIVTENLPGGGFSEPLYLQGTTDGGCGPTVTSIVRVGASPTSAASVDYTVTFSQSVTGVDASDFVLTTTGGITGTSVTNVVGTGATRTVTVATGSGDGTLRLDVDDDDTILDVGAVPLGGVGIDNGDFVTGEVYVVERAAPAVTIDQAVGQIDPTSASPVNFTVVFSEDVTGFATGDVSLVGTAGATTATVTGGPNTFNVAVSGMTGPGTVIATIGASVATDAALNPNEASTSTDNSVTFDATGPTVTIDQAVGQIDPTNASPINFTVVFSEDALGFATGDVSLGGTAGATTATVTGGPATYNVAVSGMTGPGTVIASIGASVATDALLNPNSASTSTDDTVAFDTSGPTVSIDQAVGQVDPANASPINFTVVFSENVLGFATGDVTLGGTAGATTATVTGGPGTFNVAVSGMTGPGTVIASIGAGVANDAALNPNAASTSTDNSVGFDATGPSVTINQSVGQADPTNASPINFTVVFSEDAVGFATGDVTLGGTAGATTATVTGGPGTFNVAVSGMTGPGTVIASIGPGVATDATLNPNTASTSTDNSVSFDAAGPGVTINQSVGQVDPTNASPINFTVVFSENVLGFATGDVTLGGTAGATTATVTGGPGTFNVAVSGMTGPGSVIASVGAGVATDAALNPNAASTSTDNSVDFDDVAPTATITQAVAQSDPTSGSPVRFTITFSEPVTGFTAADVTLGGTAGATGVVILGGPTGYTIEVSGMTSNGTIIVSVAAGVATDAAGNASTAAAAGDNQVQFRGFSVNAAAPTVIPATSTAFLVLLALALLAAGMTLQRPRD